MTKLRRVSVFLLALVILAGCTGQIFGTEAPVSVGFETRIPVPTAAVTVLPKDNRPNIVLILTDDLDSKSGTLDYMPHLQELMVSQGLSMKDFFVTDPTCCPSRTTILRGQYTQSHAIYTSNPIEGFQRFYALDYDSSTIATWLQTAGYQTMFLGKYLNGYPIGLDRTYVPQGWDEWYSPGRGKPYEGLNYTLNVNGTLVPYGANPEEYLLDVLSLQMETLLHDAAQSGKPFFIFMAPFQPHEPAIPAARHADLFPDLQAPRTESFNEADVGDKPGSIRYDPPLTAEQIADLDLLFRRRVQSMQSVDEMIARLFDVLQETSQLDNTYIIFTSDNGFHLGQHRLNAGKSTPYEEDINVPFVIHGPDIPANRTLAGYLVGNIDIAPTIAELAGVIPPPIIEGRSLVPLFNLDQTESLNWRQAYLVEYYLEQVGEAGTVQLASLQDRSGVLEPADWDTLQSPTPSLSYHGLRTKDYLYVEYGDRFVELYDLERDPYELENIADTADPDLLAQLSDWLKEMANCRGASCLLVESRQLP
jgi:N-acetylglucosamine-6-sulfatase